MGLETNPHDSYDDSGPVDVVFTYNTTYFGDGTQTEFDFNLTDYQLGFNVSFFDYLSAVDRIGKPNVTVIEAGTTASLPLVYDVTSPGGESDMGDFNIHFDSPIPDGEEVEIRFEVPVYEFPIQLTQGAL